MKVRIKNGDGTTAAATLSASTLLAAHFLLKELANNAGDPDQPQYEISAESLTFNCMLEEFRAWYGQPITINSGYRQQAYNNSIGGDSRSAHLHACAVDFRSSRPGDKEVSQKWLQICNSHGVIGAVNYYTHGYHLEAFSNLWYNNKYSVLREYRGKKGDW